MHTTTFGDKKCYSIVSFDSSWNPLPTCAYIVMGLWCIWPSTISYQPFNFFFIWFCSYFFISICFILIYFSNFILFLIASFFIFFYLSDIIIILLIFFISDSFWICFPFQFHLIISSAFIFDGHSIFFALFFLI